MRASDITPDNIGEHRRLERMRGLGDREVVSAWYRADDADTWNLTDRQEEIRRRVDFAKAQFIARSGYEDTMNAIATEFGCGIATARRDIAQAMNLFGQLDKVPKEAHRARAIDMALETFKVAQKLEDPTGMAKATAAYISATGLDKDDPDAVDIEKLMKERTYVEVLDPALRELLLNFLAQSGGSVDVSRLFEHIYASKNDEYIEHEAADNS
jgi:hypothetical protein